MGELVAFTAYVGQLLVPVRRLGWVIAAITQAVASGERIFEILDAKSEVEDLPGAPTPEADRGAGQIRERLLCLLWPAPGAQRHQL